jgi:demethylmenaquinone methyltransferase/2-methoxy-6-polyprenyl-1,4-benzoquinol methylase
MASLDLGKVRSRWMRPFVDAYMFHVVPRIGRLLQPGQEMFTYLPHSNTTYPHQDALKDLMLQGGFARVDLIEYLFGASVIHLAWKP